ncbi:hypothetical protein ACTXT7_001836 [Hymenolepis weldensis]
MEGKEEKMEKKEEEKRLKKEKKSRKIGERKGKRARNVVRANNNCEAEYQELIRPKSIESTSRGYVMQSNSHMYQALYYIRASLSFVAPPTYRRETKISLTEFDYRPLPNHLGEYLSPSSKPHPEGVDIDLER